MRSLVLIGIALASCYRDPVKPLDNTANKTTAIAMASCDHDDTGTTLVDVFPQGRLRTQTTGQLSGPSGRTWAGMPVPDGIPTRLGTLELFLLDPADGGHLAFYREPYDLGSCQLGNATNCAYRARFYDRGGTLAWELELGGLLSRPDHLEIQDIRLAGGVLYFNEACQSYAREAQGQCSSLVAVDPRAHRVLWRTPPLTSNGRFRVRGCYIVAGYGFTSEPDALFLVERSSGAVLQKLPVSSAPQRLALAGKDRLAVTLYSGLTRRFRLDGMDAGNGALVALDGDPDGGATYGGATYGQMPAP